MADITTVQRVPVAEPRAHIDTAAPETEQEDGDLSSLIRLHEFASAQGDISHLLEPRQLSEIGVRAVREWRIDEGSRADWKERAERALAIAAQERDGDDERDPIWENAADIHYPILTVASQQFAARAYPELVRGDKVVGVKVFSPPPVDKDPLQSARDGPQPQTEQEAQAATQALQAAQQAAAEADQRERALNARAERVKHYLNWIIFYQMDNWEGETDALLHEAPVVGTGFKKVYMGTTGLCSDYISALRLTVHNDTKSIFRCPRITQDFEVYPYEIEDRTRAGTYRKVSLAQIGEDPEQPRKFIEQHRLDDLDADGLAEPYIVTVDIDTQQVLRVECAYTADDIYVNEATGKVMRIERWLPFPAYFFLPDPKGRFYGIGFGRLLESITDSIDTSLNQLIDAGSAEIAGGGFIASGVRLQGSAGGGAAYFRPGEYQTVGTPGMDLRQAIWERTVPHPSAVTMQMLELLLAAAKDIASVKDVITGDAPSTAPVGTTLALQNQALQVFSSIYKRIYRGFRDEFRLMYRALKRWGTDRERQQYKELTGGDFDQDFQGDGTEIQPVADPTVVTKMQKVARMQTVVQLAESPLGMAAGMTQPAQAQQIIKDLLADLDVGDNIDKYVGAVAPDPLAQAKAQEIQSKAALNEADAQAKPITAMAELKKAGADATLTTAKALREVGLAAQDTHALHQEADRIAQTGSVATHEQLPPPEGEEADGASAS